MAHERRDTTRQFWIAAVVSLSAALAFYFSTKATLHDLDYTSQIASALLRGDLGRREKPPDWLNEMIPQGERYYSAFPLGAVLSMVPIALLQKAGLIHDFPGHVLAALIAGLCVYFFFQLAKAFGADYSSHKSTSLVRRILLALFPIFGTWTWCNLGFGGAWQIALGLALMGQTAALYFSLVRPSPFVAGAFFALAFGNRTELLITLPLYLYFLWRQPNGTTVNWKNFKRVFPENMQILDRCDSVEYVHDAVPRIREYFLLSLHPTKRVRLLNLPCQPFPVPPFSSGRTIQGGRMGSDRPLNTRPLVSWQPRKLAVFVSLRDGSPSLDVSPADRQRSSENNCQRDLPFRRIRCDQCNRYLAISLD